MLYQLASFMSTVMVTFVEFYFHVLHNLEKRSVLVQVQLYVHLTVYYTVSS